MSQVPVTILPHGKSVQLELFEIAPGVQVAAKPAKVAAPRVGIVYWEPQPGGLFRPKIETHPVTVNIRQWNERVYGCGKLIILALVEAGLVEGERLSPRTMNINLESFFQYKAMIRENQWFWQDADNRARYSKALDKIKGEWRHKRRPSKTAQDAPEGAGGVVTLPTSQRPRRGAAKGQSAGEKVEPAQKEEPELGLAEQGPAKSAH